MTLVLNRRSSINHVFDYYRDVKSIYKTFLARHAHLFLNYPRTKRVIHSYWRASLCRYVLYYCLPYTEVCVYLFILSQGLLQLMESEVTVIPRPKDVELVEKAVEGAKEQYSSLSGREITVNISEELSDTMYVSSGSHRPLAHISIAFV